MAEEIEETKDVPPISLVDGSGGLNNRDLPGALRLNEFSELDGFYTDEGGFPGKQMPGAETLQYAPIDPQIFAAEASTLGLWHLDELGDGDSAADTSGNSIDLIKVGIGAASSAQAIFPVGAPLGRRMLPPSVVGDIFAPNHFLRTLAYTGHQGLPKITFDAWIIIDPDFSGRPVTQDGATVSNSASPLIAIGDDLNGTNILHGLRIYRDWDADAGKDASDPYVKFILGTAGIAGTQTEITSRPLPTSKGLHIRGQYDFTTGYMDLLVNGSLHARATPNGGGAVAATGIGLMFGGNRAGTIPVFGSFYRAFKGVIDEFRLSSDVFSAFPFKKPHSMMKDEFAKSDGTRQLLVGAGDGLYFSPGDGLWYPIATGLSGTARWDFLQMGDFVIMCNGVDTPLVWDGSTTTPWGNPVTPLILSQLGSGATPTAGIRKYVWTAKYGDEETGPSPPATMDQAGNTAINVAGILARHSDCDSLRVWRTVAGGDDYFLIREIENDLDVAVGGQFTMEGPWVDNNSPQADTGGDGVPDGDLGTGGYIEMPAEVLTSAMPNPRYLTENYDRVFMAGPDIPYQMAWTEPGLHHIRLAASFVSAHGGREITALSKYTGEVHAHKDGHGCLVLRGDKPSNWRALEDLHPTRGSTDHFGIIYRTIPRGDGEAGDRTEVCFPSIDGFYGYQGYEFYRIDDRIDGTFKDLARANGTRQEFLVSTQAQFQAGIASGGAASANVNNTGASVDGLSDEPGKLKIVDQLDYIGLWGSNDSYLPTGVGDDRVAAIAKGPAEGEFYFAVKGVARTIYRTTDNFVTATALPLFATADDFVNEIVYASIGGLDNLFVAVTTADDAGSIYRIVDPTGGGGVGPVPTVLAANLFWQADTLFEFGSAYAAQASVPNPPSLFAPAGSLNADQDYGASLLDNFLSKGGHAIGDPYAPNIPFSVAIQVIGDPGTPNNLYLNHQQKILFDPNVALSALTILSAPSLTGQATAKAQVDVIGGAYSVAIAAGFYATRDSTSYYYNGGSRFAFAFNNSDGYRVEFTRRETSLWGGGTFRPQMFWDATNSKLWYVAGGAEDANGNRTCTLYSHNLAAATAVAATMSYMALANDGTNAWFVDSIQDPALLGFTSRLRKVVLASGVVSTIGSLTKNYLVTRLSYNASSGRLVAGGKSFNVSARNAYQFQGFLAGLTTAGVFTVLKTMTANEAVSAFPQELAYQTVTPFAQFAVMQNLQTAEPSSVYRIAKESAAETDVSSFKGSGYDEDTLGCLSNALFVPASGDDNSNLWADRLYWAATRDTGGDGVVDDAKPVQLGLPGTWKVIGTYTCELKNLGVFTAFDSFDTDYSGNIVFAMANGAVGPFASADFKVVAPNQKITIAGAAPGVMVQWNAVLTWEYSVAVPTASPEVSFVSIGYFLGTASLPHTVGIHFLGRSRWSVATFGAETNDMELVYNKQNRWNPVTQRRILAYGVFRGDLVAFEDYTLIRMETGTTWLGAIIRPRAVTGYIMNEERDKYVRRIASNVMQYLNRNFPTKQGWVKVTPLRAGEAIEGGEWFVPLPATGVEPRPRQVQGVMDPFTQAWARSMALEISVPDETEGDFVPAAGQSVHMQALILHLRQSPVRYTMAVD